MFFLCGDGKKPGSLFIKSIQRSFRKCGAIDASEDDQINIRGLDNYQVPRSVDFSDPDGNHFDSGVDECSDSSEASASNSAVSSRGEIID